MTSIHWRFIRCLVLCLPLLATGCLTWSSRSKDETFATKLGGFHRASVEIASTATPFPQPFDELLRKLQDLIVAELRDKKVFDQVFPAPGDAQFQPDVRVRVVVLGVTDVSRQDRLLGGNFAGDARVRSRLEVLEGQSTNLIGSCELKVQTWAGTIFGPTTDDALEGTARAVRRVLVKNK